MYVKKPLQLLHVDDSSVLRKTIARGLEPFKEHYELTQVESVDEALHLMASGQKFDIILTDWLMNGKSGLQFLCLLKSDPAYHHLPVFFLTSEYDSNSLIIAVTHGASGILKKPTSGPDIHAYIQKKMSVIEESMMPKEDLFVVQAKPILNEIPRIQSFKSANDLKLSLEAIQKFKTKAAAFKWPLLADYSQKIEDTIQLTLKLEANLLTPITRLINEYQSCMDQALTDLEYGRPHQMMCENIDKNLKNYQVNLEAGWFTNRGPQENSNEVILPWATAVELQQHLTPEGLEILRQYLKR
ncbi:hypothetical protein AZI86_08210 [Bdellovibrio bacteriovorus]|uniref:Response regulatory domain-containing protein n=1 Tax=Bdellovibrio bacteriovorus TaxID=959 RepID=A0A150WS18_BDEBC|nr:response regulator [Bdellovibrio bacteriovorus]KYG66995.1 hypothetical protein AZI86_08210 [Bdellovibrio bacteriovorus]